MNFCLNCLLSLDCQNGLETSLVSSISFRWALGRGFVLSSPIGQACGGFAKFSIVSQEVMQ